MKRKTKIIVTIILLMITAFFISGCSAEKKAEPEYGVVEEATYRQVVSDSFAEILEDAGVTANEASEDSKKEISKLEEDLVEFINEEYDLNWEASGVEVYELDFSLVEGYGIYNAMADPEANSFYLNTAIDDASDSRVQFISGHELVHCLTYKNLGTYKFVLKDSEGAELGYYTSEAFADLLAIKFFESREMPEVRDFFYSSSGYCYTTCALVMLEKSIPNEMYYFLTNDMESLERDFNELADKYIKMPDGYEDNAFEAFLYRTDLNLAITRTIAEGYLTSDLSSMWLQTIFGNFETVALLSRGQTDEVKQEIYDECYGLFESEGEITGDLKTFTDYLKSCMR